MTEDIIKEYVKHCVDTTQLKFGYNSNITDYQYIRYRDSSSLHPDCSSGEYIMIECEYMEKSDHSWSITGEAVRNTHSFEVKREKIIEFNRTNKLNILL